MPRTSVGRVEERRVPEQYRWVDDILIAAFSCPQVIWQEFDWGATHAVRVKFSHGKSRSIWCRVPISPHDIEGPFYDINEHGDREKWIREWVDRYETRKEKE